MQQSDLTALRERLEEYLKDDPYEDEHAHVPFADLRAAAKVVRDSPELLGALKLMFDSAYPHPVEHPTMFKAWGEVRILLIRHGAIKPSDPEDSI